RSDRRRVYLCWGGLRKGGLSGAFNISPRSYFTFAIWFCAHSIFLLNSAMASASALSPREFCFVVRMKSFCTRMYSLQSSIRFCTKGLHEGSLFAHPINCFASYSIWARRSAAAFNASGEIAKSAQALINNVVAAISFVLMVLLQSFRLLRATTSSHRHSTTQHRAP